MNANSTQKRNNSRIDDTKPYDPAQAPKVTKPAEHVLTRETTPSWEFGLAFGGTILALTLFVAALYYGIINP